MVGNSTTVACTVAMNQSNSQSAEFRKELSQLVRKHIDNGKDPTAIADALNVQAEMAKTQASGSGPSESPSRPQSPHENRQWYDND